MSTPAKPQPAPAAAAAAAPQPEEHIDNTGEQVITPWEVVGGAKGIDYDKLIRDFGAAAARRGARCAGERPGGAGSDPIDEKLLQRMERIIKRPVHPWLRRGACGLPCGAGCAMTVCPNPGMFFSHRELSDILVCGSHAAARTRASRTGSHNPRVRGRICTSPASRSTCTLAAGLRPTPCTWATSSPSCSPSARRAAPRRATPRHATSHRRAS
jgi:hypothetical protein